MTDVHELREELVELKEKRERLDARIGDLSAQISNREAANLESFEDMSPAARRELKKNAPDRYRELQQARREKGEDALMETNPNRFGG